MAAAALDETGQALAQDQNGQGVGPADEQRQPRERRSRDRYGRDRRERGEERGENGERSEQPAEGTAAPAGAAPAQAPAQEERAPVAAEFAAPTTPSANVPAPAPAQAPAPAYTAPAAVAAPVVAPPPVPAPAAAGITLPKVQAYALPLQDLAQVAESSGLQWVNSDAAKIAEAQAAIAAEIKPAHVPRERPPLAVSDEGPLVLVETKRDLGSMTLPFEQPPA